MRCPILVGRRDATALMASAVGQLGGQRRGGALVLAGEAGVGKSRLTEHLRAAAIRARVRVVTGRALPAGIGGMLGPVAEVLLDVVRGCPLPDDDELAPYLAVLASVLPDWRGAGWSAPAEPVVVTAEAVLRVLRWATGSAGVVVILEDLHWADDATLAVVRYLVDHSDEVPMVLLATVRTGDGRDDVQAVLGAAGAQVCPIGRLSATETRDMAAACAGVGAGSALDGRMAAVVNAAEGLPLLVEDLLATGYLGGLPPRFADTVRARVGRLDGGQRRVLEAAALLGRRFDWRLLEQAAGVGGDTVAAALHRGTASQLVVNESDGFEFRHALTRDVILADMAAADRMRLSLAAADALGSGDDGHALSIGRLLVAGGESARAARVLLEAGGRAFGAGDFADAERLLREADRSAEGLEGLRITVAVRLAEVLLVAGKPAEAADVAGGAVGAADGRDRAAATALRLILARALVMTARWDDARARLDQVRRGLGADRAMDRGADRAIDGAVDRVTDGAIGAEIALIESQVALGDGRAGGRARAERLAVAAAELAAGADRPDLCCEALETLGSCARLYDLDAAAAAFGQALDLAAATGLRVHRLRILSELGAVEMLRDARGERLQEARAEAVRAGAVGLAVGIGANIAALLAMTARFDDVMAVAAEVERSAQRLGLVPLQAAALLMQGFAQAHQGRARDMERYLGAAEALAPDDPDLRAGAWGIGRGLGALLAEDRAGARLAFARARQEAPDQHARILNPYEGPELLLRAVLGEADRDEVDAAAGGIVKGARWPALWHGAAQAVAAGAAGDAAAAAGFLTAALAAGSRYPVFSALVERMVAEAGLRDGWGTPETLLRSADGVFARLGLGRASSACRVLLKAAGHPAPRRRGAEAGLPLPASLAAAGVTAREAEVLDLLGDRLANREIAERLFLSPRTVEKHVAALLVKLGAPDRGSLARLARSLR